MTTPSSAAAFEALAVVVRDRGIDIADEPARLRGMLNDVLATDARVNRTAVDAVVLAAEIGVPRALSSTPVADVPRLTGQLVSRGVAPDLADQTVRAWMVAAQGGRTAPAPTPAPATPVAPAAATVLPSTVLPAAARPAAMAPPPPPPTGTVPTTSPTADAADQPTAAIPPVLVPPPPPGPPAPDGGRGVPRRAVVLAVAAVVAVLAIVGAVLAMGGGGDDDEASGPTTTAPASTTTSTPPVGDVTLEVLAPAAGTEATTRDVELSGRTDAGATVTVNGTAAAVDATGAWKLAVTLAEAENTFSIVATTSTGSTRTVEWVVKRDATPPGLEITSPAEGTVSDNPVVRLRGTVEAGAAVQIDGVGPAPDPAVTNGWLTDVTINGTQQTFTVTATDPAGNVTTKTITLSYQPPFTPPAPRPTPTTRPPTPGPTPGPGTTAAPAPTLVAAGDDAGTWNFQAGGRISFNVVGNDSGDWTDIEYGGLSGGYGTLSRLSGGFFQYTMRDAGNWTESFQYRLRNSSTGAVSNWATVTFFIVCSC